MVKTKNLPAEKELHFAVYTPILAQVNTTSSHFH
jgi:hypothetical protein